MARRIVRACTLAAALLAVGCGVFGPPVRPDTSEPGAGASATCGDKNQH